MSYTISRGDNKITLPLRAKLGSQYPSLTGATFQSFIKLHGAVMDTIPNEQHTAASDQREEADAGRYGLTFLSANTTGVPIETAKDISTTITWPDGTVITFHAYGILNAVPANPRA